LSTKWAEIFTSNRELLKVFFFIRETLKSIALNYQISLEYRNLIFNGMVWTIFWKHFSFDFDFQCNHSIDKIVLFRSVQGRARWLAPFRSYTHLSESLSYILAYLDPYCVFPINIFSERTIQGELLSVLVSVSWDVCTRYKSDSGCYYGRANFLVFSDGFLPYNPYKVGACGVLINY
jgi:hypothetical protein